MLFIPKTSTTYINTKKQEQNNVPFNAGNIIYK